MNDFLSELLDTLPSARGRRSRLVAAKRRDISPPDIDALSNARPLEQVTPVQQLRHQHHLLARLLGEGKQLTEAAEITGYSIAYISRLNTQDRAFRELVKYYQQQVGEVYVNVHERLAGLGLNTVEELQERLAVRPETFANRELMELAELCFDRSGHGPTSTNRAVLAVLTSEDIERLKGEVARRQTGTITQVGGGAILGGTVIEGTVYKDTPSGVQGVGAELSEKSWKEVEEDL